MNFIKKFIAKRAAKALVGAVMVFIITNAQSFGVETPPDAAAWIEQLLTSLAAAGLTYAGVYRVSNKE